MSACGDAAARSLAEEGARLDALRSLNILDAEVNPPGLSWVVDACCALFNVPIALVSLVSEHTQRFLANHGALEDVKETPREVSFCQHAIRTPDSTFVVNDATKVRSVPFKRFSPTPRFQHLIASPFN